MNYKLPSSKMTNKMNKNNLKIVKNKDVYKFVLGNIEDLKVAYGIIKEYDLDKRCLVYFSPVFGKIKLEDVVEFIKEKNLNRVRFQIQLHKLYGIKIQEALTCCNKFTKT